MLSSFSSSVAFSSKISVEYNVKDNIETKDHHWVPDHRGNTFCEKSDVKVFLFSREDARFINLSLNTAGGILYPSVS